VYEAMRHNGELTERMLALMLRGVSTRNYAEVLPKMAEQVGISRSQVSRASIEAGEKLLKELAEGRPRTRRRSKARQWNATMVRQL
jgi:putative transposase